VTAALASRVRWLEPLGQLTALVALGLQFFLVNPAIEISNQASIGYIQALLEQHTLPEHPERAQTALEMDKEKVTLIDAQISAKERKVEADRERTRSSHIYIGLFVFGTIMAIIGKWASVAYSTKLPPIK
jgi:hypothetical protein